MSKRTYAPSDPFENQEERFGQNIPLVRRAVEFKFKCPICRQRHTFSYYVTVRVSTLPEFKTELTQTVANQEHIRPMLVPTLHAFHPDKGSFKDMERILVQKPPKVKFRITEESEYTCDWCHQTFPTVAGLRLHQGYDPYSNMPKTTPACRAMAPIPSIMDTL